MEETSNELAALQELLVRSIEHSGPHLRSIVEPARTLDAATLCDALTGICVLNVATATSAGRPRLSAVDGHFRHGKWYFTTSTSAVKVRHLRERPDVSVSFTPRDGFGVWAHGTASFIERDTEEWRDLDDYLQLVYLSSPSEWGPGIAYLRVDAGWMVAFSLTPSEQQEADRMAQERADRLAERATVLGTDRT